MIVKILSGDDGEIRDNPVWCLIHPMDSDPSTLCQNEYFGEGQSSCTFELKEGKVKDLTCPSCLAFIRHIKKLK